MAPVRFTVLAPKAAALGIRNFRDLDHQGFPTGFKNKLRFYPHQLESFCVFAIKSAYATKIKRLCHKNYQCLCHLNSFRCNLQQLESFCGFAINRDYAIKILEN